VRALDGDPAALRGLLDDERLLPNDAAGFGVATHFDNWTRSRQLRFAVELAPRFAARASAQPEKNVSQATPLNEGS